MLSHDPAAIDIPVHCQHCGAPIQLIFTDWSNDGPLIDACWPCPRCRRENRASFAGRLVASKGRVEEAAAVSGAERGQQTYQASPSRLNESLARLRALGMASRQTRGGSGE